MQKYNLSVEKAVEEIKKAKAKLVCIQLPDGLKPEAKEVADYIEKNTQAKTIIWLGSCFGACDMPSGLENLGVDFLIQWGHTTFEWKRQKLND
ncbi:diphthamide synthesis protein [Candidatus Woesearchaeota archaeon]|nr:diphthamide synthesis protein [Candidatus Woesearchaeota archaeon]